LATIDQGPREALAIGVRSSTTVPKGDSMPNSVVHFEIPADDITRAKAFYEKTFGWKIKPFPMPPGHEYYGVTTRKKGEPGIDGGMMKRNMPGQRSPITLP
jgi:predicted enzyme related to lactoylglutathione lyase